MKKIKKILLLMGCVMFLHSINVAASDWFVRPRGGNYGSKDGSSYDDAWDGVNNILWGSGGVQAGDTLYVCGTFDRDTEANPSALIDIRASGSPGNPITIRGDYKGDPGWLIGAKKITSWTDNGDGTYQAPWNRLGYEAWEGVPGGTEYALKPVTSAAEVAATDGSHWWDSASKIMWYNPTGNPANPRTVYSNWFWTVDGNGHDYITLYKLTCYCGGNSWGVIQFERTNDPTGSEYFTVDNCRIKYAASDGIKTDRLGNHYTITNCTITDYTVGIYINSAGGGPDDVIISNNYFNCGDAGYYSYWSTFRGISDRGAIAIQSGDNYEITDNHIARSVDYGIFFFRFSQNSAQNIHILRNVIENISDPQDAYYSFGIGMGGGNGAGAGEYRNGMVIAHNIVKDCKRSSYDSRYGIGLRLSTGKHTDPADRPLIYGNVVAGCDTNYNLNSAATPSDEHRGEYIFYNNISYKPNHVHCRIYFGYSYDLDMGYNCWYPDTINGKNIFIWQSKEVNDFNDFVSKAAAGGAGVIGEHSLVVDPFFVDADNNDYHLRYMSPLIDAGIEAGFTHDIEGTAIPQGNAPDIGAYEYVPDPTTNPFAVNPDITALHVYNNIIKKSENTSAMILCNLKEAGNLSLKIYDAKGKEIVTLCNEHKDVGIHTFNWAGNNAGAKTVGSGIYMVHMKSGGNTETKKIAVIK